ncbi:MAG: group II intron maturase-specific domain-containing protein [Pirellulaceae bacterium]
MKTPIGKARGEGNCVGAIQGGDEAGAQSSRLRTETSYKAGPGSYARGWMGYFGLAAQLKLFDRLDQWLRRRIRACYWKQWRCPKRRREMLIRLGVPRRQAIRHARSRKGPWHMARYLIGIGHCQWSWPDQRVARRTGVLSLKTHWAALARLR